MKRTLTALLAGALTLAIFAAPTFAQDADNGNGQGQRIRKHRRDGKGPRARRGNRTPAQHMQKLLNGLDLTEEQQKQVKQIVETHTQAVENFHKENREKHRACMAEMKKAAQAKDREAMQTARGKMKGLMGKRMELHENLMKQLGDVLTEEQMEKVKSTVQQHRRGGRRGMMAMGALRRLDLTDDQKTEVKKIMAAAGEAVQKAEKPEEKREARQAAWEKIKTDVLTDEQRKKLEEMRKPGKGHGRGDGPLAKLDLTETQKTQIREIVQAGRKKAAEAEGKEAKMKIYREIREKLREVLTDEQEKQLDEMRKERG
ncbi:MAG: Spy/CpxP family protein refolding chaperone, partial [Phycisphaerae bacterium]